jgi:hypothetical protein
MLQLRILFTTRIVLQILQQQLLSSDETDAQHAIS